jgi:1,4-dihydroxy-2-naphthoyl-CoA synthase
MTRSSAFAVPIAAGISGILEAALHESGCAHRTTRAAHPERAMTQPSVLFEVQDGYALVTLNRPDKLNSFTAERHERLRDALTAVKSRDDVRALLLTARA